MCTALILTSATDPPNLMRPDVWTMARVNAARLHDLNQRIAESEARSDALAAEVMVLMAAKADSRQCEQQMWDILDGLQRLRLGQWVLLQAPL